MTRPQRISYAFIFATIVLVGWLHLATPMIAVLFSYFALEKLRFTRSKWLAIGLFLLLVSAMTVGFFYFARQAIGNMQGIAETSIPRIIDFARNNSIDLPFEDWESLKALAIDTIRHQLRSVGNFAKVATKEFAALVIGIVVAISIFLNATLELGRDTQKMRNNLYSISIDQIGARFRMFYRSFATVMGAQLTISAINTGLTSIFIFWTHLPYATLVVVVTFLCGLIPIIGNLISNSVIVGIAFTISPKFALIALAFLIVLHKLEYFLNSKIIGDRIKNPMWLTLLSLIVAEKLMGIPGMILAPVILHYLKMETSTIEVPVADAPLLAPLTPADSIAPLPR